jgi:dihydroorotate dehydrogenase electron transfer subunit
LPKSKKAYYNLCRSLLEIILKKDDWSLADLHAGRADGKNDPFEFPGLGKSLLGRCAFAAYNKDRCILFCFDHQPKKELSAFFRELHQAGRNQFKVIGVLIFRDAEAMRACRQSSCAEKSPGAFFTTFQEIRDQAREASEKAYLEIAGEEQTTAPDPPCAAAGPIKSFTAKVLANARVGGKTSGLYRLAFESPELERVSPGQFVMMDSRPYDSVPRKDYVSRGKAGAPGFLTPRSYLKRPFGIHRLFYPNFPADFLTRLSLPPYLSLVLHTVYPDRFEILYKVLPDGIGTPEMTKLQKDDRVHMLGPLGKPFDFRGLRPMGVKEVHVIGGGVGMAPLVMFVHALRYFSFNVKVFLGIADAASLLYEPGDDWVRMPGDNPQNAYLYIDDLLTAGMDPADIYVSYDSQKEITQKPRGIPPANQFYGLVGDQYGKYLEENKDNVTNTNIEAFACGPTPMMRSLNAIAERWGIHLKVLMEKRMSCGIGVCLSCVCRLKQRDDSEEYARVCTDGPIFKASDLEWAKID